MNVKHLIEHHHQEANDAEARGETEAATAHLVQALLWEQWTDVDAGAAELALGEAVLLG